MSTDLQKEVELLIQTDLQWDEIKVRRWMTMPNPLLGGVTPDEMIEMGRGEKLLRFVKAQLEENRPPESGAKSAAKESGTCEHKWHFDEPPAFGSDWCSQCGIEKT